MRKKVIVTGANGFTGKYLMRELIRHGLDVIGTWHSSSPDEENRAEWRQIDLLHFEECQRLIHAEKPDAVIHLAAQNSVVAARENPRQTIESNVLGAVNLLEAVRMGKRPVKCVLAGSAAIYDAARSGAAITEECSVKPQNLYAVTKIFQEQIAERFCADYGMEIICTRPFNYSGYLQGENCFLPSLCRQVSEIASGRRVPVLTLGNLDVSRDFLDVRDVAAAYRLLLEDDVPEGVYNIASGESVKLIDIAVYLCGKSGREIEIKTDPALLRKNDIVYICGDATKLKSATGWKANYSIFDTVDWIYDSMQGENRW
ncbi:MAG: GDP-mannose 4,6-dehydratase [Muribaculum sp.]|nr:GDP-mannose 4,6-dehydratase [Muribaculum sp.]